MRVGGSEPADQACIREAASAGAARSQTQTIGDRVPCERASHRWLAAAPGPQAFADHNGDESSLRPRHG
jgi:hypothetical protein